MVKLYTAKLTPNQELVFGTQVRPFTIGEEYVLHTEKTIVFSDHMGEYTCLIYQLLKPIELSTHWDGKGLPFSSVPSGRKKIVLDIGSLIYQLPAGHPSFDSLKGYHFTVNIVGE